MVCSGAPGKVSSDTERDDPLLPVDTPLPVVCAMTPRAAA